MEPKEAVKKLSDGWDCWGEIVWARFNSGQYKIIEGSAPDEYNESYSEICWGWLSSGPQTDPIVATFAHGERGNESFDPDNDGLVIWVQGDDIARRNAEIERASKALIAKKIGMGEFKAIIKANS